METWPRIQSSHEFIIKQGSVLHRKDREASRKLRPGYIKKKKNARNDSEEKEKDYFGKIFKLDERHLLRSGCRETKDPKVSTHLPAHAEDNSGWDWWGRLESYVFFFSF